MHSDAMQSIHTNICPVCGTKFARTCSAKAWGYAYDNALVCSYRCMREAERRDRETEESNVKGTKQERMQQTAMIARLYRDGMGVYEIAGQLNKSTSTIYSALKRSGIQVRVTKPKKEEPKPMEEVKAVEEAVEQMEDLRGELENLRKQMAEQKALADAAIDLMMAWKEKFELTEWSRKIAGELEAREAAYFAALRAARPGKEGA